MPHVPEWALSCIGRKAEGTEAGAQAAAARLPDSKRGGQVTAVGKLSTIVACFVQLFVLSAQC